MINQKISIEMSRQQETQELEKAQRAQFNALISLCQTCKNSMQTRYQDNPNKSDPLDVICKVKAQLLSPAISNYRLDTDSLFECRANWWNRKVIGCSEYVLIEANELKENQF